MVLLRVEISARAQYQLMPRLWFLVGD